MIAVKNLKITYVTHACIKLQGEFGSLITDPWILNEPIYALTTWKFPPAIIPPEELIKDLDFIYISHPHEDHLHIPSLHHFPRDVTVLLPEYSDYPGLRSQTVELTLRKMGFYNIRKIRPWETILLNNKTPFTIIPASRSKYWDWENSGFVLEHPDCKIINMNDCPADQEIYAEVDKRFGEIDIGFVQYSGVSMFPGRYRMPIEEMREASSKRKHSWSQQKNMIEFLRVKRLAPFAGDFAWLDDSLFHCNWANRATPKLFENFVNENYSDKNLEVVIMYPRDEWTKQEGLTRNHPEIDWNNYIESIKKVKNALQFKVDAINSWQRDCNLDNLKERSIEFTDHLNKWMTKEYVDFTSRVRFIIEGEDANFSFVIKANPTTKVIIDWNDHDNVDQSLFIRQHSWAAILEGKLLLTNIQWAAENLQHETFRIEIARFWFWFENHIDLNNRNSQALIDDALHPQIKERIRPLYGVFTEGNDWEAVQSLAEPVLA